MSDYAVVLCARANSERLPGKALAELATGVTVLDALLARWQASDRAPTVILATPQGAANDPLAAVAVARGVPVSRQPPGNPLAEMDAAVRRYAPGAAYVARALADNPLVDVGLADWRLDVLDATGADGLWYGEGGHDDLSYCATTDVWSRAAWDRIVAESSGPQTEHPGAAFWAKIDSYNVVQLPPPRREYRSGLRTELDTLFDLEVFQAVWAGWDRPEPPETLWALKWLAAHPLVAAVNAKVVLKTISKPQFHPRDKAWLCPKCSKRMGGIREGNLEIHCHTCGTPRRFFASKPKGRGVPDMGWVP
jgi:spore coat polysaccharide biosynthesis protein SpsF (cytidylyltransferase family)